MRLRCWLSALFVAYSYAQPAPVVFGASGAGATALRPAVTSFQENMGPLNLPGAPGDPSGRREINWDGVPAEVSFPNRFPADFFNRNSARGMVLTVDGLPDATFQVSPINGNFSPENGSVFTIFSAEKVFYSVETHVYNFDFYVPGTRVQGKVKGFGIVFANVSLPFTTSIELFNEDGLSLGRFFAPVAANGLSFIGVAFPNRMVTRVRVVPGNASIATKDDPANGKNVVVIDDVIYGEPVNNCVAN